jgi:hypothetical protein
MNFRNINKIEKYSKFKFKEFRLTSFSKPTDSDKAPSLPILL